MHPITLKPFTSKTFSLYVKRSFADTTTFAVGPQKMRRIYAEGTVHCYPGSSSKVESCSLLEKGNCWRFWIYKKRRKNVNIKSLNPYPLYDAVANGLPLICTTAPWSVAVLHFFCSVPLWKTRAVGVGMAGDSNAHKCTSAEDSLLQRDASKASNEGGIVPETPGMIIAPLSTQKREKKCRI